jgi:RNA polymerase sigma-70 factor (ECF subfamily)
MYELEATAEVLIMTAPGKAATDQRFGERAAAVATATAQARPANDHESIEAQLVRLVLAGDRDRFGRLYELYAPLVHGILLARMPRSEVEDTVQEIFLHAFKKLDTLRDPNAFGPWIGMIARNRAMDFHRKSRDTVELTEDLKSADSSGAKAEEILAIIRLLPDAYRETLVLRLVEGMTGPEIAVRTGLTAASVRVNLHRGMKLLRAKLGFEEGLHE